MVELKSGDDFEELKSKVSFMDSKLKEAERSIMKLTEERSIATREKDKLKGELELLKRKSDVRTIQVGFPFLYCCMVAVISLAVGYFSHLYEGISSHETGFLKEREQMSYIVIIVYRGSCYLV
ncbi:Uncharacterized protein TCM_035273 [Theobroma cacao]|uniref:Uncharacterized protein n=1 Tax=Theobroma cacao TaxID=3641 RepID=A0A061FPN0_THECC|nr:Uncharacterized protein TCM_035273 [Theobroma cacao]